MRFDTPIYFQTVQQGAYDPKTGNYAPETVTEVKGYASVTDSSAETLNLIYGQIKQGSRIIRLQTPYKEPFSRIRIGNTIYRVDRMRRLRTKQTFIVSEVQQNGET